MWVKALQKEHLSQEVEDDSMKQIPDDIDFSMEPAGTDETDRQSEGMAEQLTLNSSPPKNEAASESSSSTPLSPLKPAIAAKPSLAVLASRRLSQANQQTSKNENTSLPADNYHHHPTLPSEEQKPFSIPFDLETPSLLQSTPLSSLDLLSDR